jgi:hypothetical protein
VLDRRDVGDESLAGMGLIDAGFRGEFLSNLVCLTVIDQACSTKVDRSVQRPVSPRSDDWSVEEDSRGLTYWKYSCPISFS